MSNENQNRLAVEKSDVFKTGNDAGKQKEKTTTEAKSEEKDEGKDKKITPLKNDSETTVATDPQEKMEGPISSIMQNIKEAGEATDVVSKEEADEKKDKNI